MADKYIPQVDYTSRDYTSLRDDMISLIPDYAPKWTNREPSDFGMTMLELFAYMGDLLNYYVDRSANEAFIGTASQRDSVLQISRLLGYKPVENTGAKVTLTFYNSTASPITVPAKTQVSTSSVASGSNVQIIFETDAVATIPAKVGAVNGSAQVAATQGTTITNEVIGTSSGQLNQVYKLSSTSVINNSITITSGNTSYTQVPYLIDYNGYDAVFSVYTNAEGTSYVLFGDGISGRIPTNSSVIYATYRVGGGIVGNVAAGSIKTILTNNQVGLSVLNTSYGNPEDDGSARGGTDSESTDSIRINAPLSLRTINRAVSLSDYAALVKASGMSKASAVADVYTSVTVFFVPYGDKGVLENGTTPSTVFTNSIPTIKTYLKDKIPANTTVTYQPASYVGVNLIAQVVVLPKFNQYNVTLQTDSAVSALFALDNVAFQDTIYVHDVFNAITSIYGVASVKILKLVRDDQDQSFFVNNKVLLSNKATLTTTATHNITVGQTIFVSSIGTEFDGTFVVNEVTSNTISYTSVATNVNSAAVSSGAVTVLNVKDIICEPNEIPELKSSTISYNGGIV